MDANAKKTALRMIPYGLYVFVGEVVDAAVSAEISGRPDDATLLLKDLGEKTFYGG